MSIQAVGLKAYSNALGNFMKAEQATRTTPASTASGVQAKTFTNTLSESLTKVNDMQTEKASMIQAFASGETQNVHELMITLQKAGLAVNMTSAVRNKVMEAYKELSRIQF
ncbi:flagellar hook-basal body complex protein FliE [Nitratidesulfovibrio sp.]|uniref:flagellar hook-basal body complex protein FliE n=1 Tax=Nitratidesulfovibrio sp. TaxID=2802297 RepID=UPI00333E1C05